jgi:hypothetical protein
MLPGRIGTLKILFRDLWHLQVDVHRAGRCHVGSEAVGREATSVEDGEVGRAEGLKLRLRRTNEHVVHEQAVVRSSRDHADPDAALRQGQRESVAPRLGKACPNAGCDQLRLLHTARGAA